MPLLHTSFCEYGWSAFLIKAKTTATQGTFAGFKSIENTVIQTKTNDVISINSCKAITDIIFTCLRAFCSVQLCVFPASCTHIHSPIRAHMKMHKHAFC